MTGQRFLQHSFILKAPVIWLTLFCIIAVLPVALMLAKSLLVEGNLSLGHYIDVYSESRLLSLLLRSMLMAMGATCLSLLFGVPFAFFLARFDFYGKKPCSFLYLVPLFIPPHIHALAWMYLCGEKGQLNRWLMHVLHLDTPVFNLYSVTGSVVILFLSYFPLMVLLTLTGLAGVDRRLEESAEFQHPPLTVLRKITLPLIAPYIVSGAVFVFIFSFFNYGVPSMLRIPSYPGEIFTRFSAFYDEAGAAALSAPLIVLALMLLLFQGTYMKNKMHVTIKSGSRKISSSLLSGKSRLIPVYMYCVLSAAVFLPIFALMMQAGSPASYKMALQTSFSEMKTTFLVAVGGATCTSILACFLGRHMEQLPPCRRHAFEMVTFIPFAFPAIFFGIGLIHLWNTPSTQFIYSTFFILIIACIARFIPFAIQIVSARLGQIDPGLHEVACFCKSGVLRRWYCIDFPLMRQGIVVCWIITFIFCTGELGATLLVIPPGYGTVSLKIYSLMHYGAGPLVAALALILISANLLVSCGLLLPDPIRHT